MLMAILAQLLLPAEDRRVLAWSTGAATAALLGAALLQKLPWALSGRNSAFASSEALIFLAVATFVVTFAATFASVRADAPVWIWLAPAVVATWSLLKPLVIVAAFGWEGALTRLDISSAWSALAPIVALALPAARAARLASRPSASLFPEAEQRRFALGIALLALLVLIVNGIAMQIGDGGFSHLLGSLSDTQALRIFFVANIVGPLLLTFILTAVGVSPPSAWVVICIPALAFPVTAVLSEGLGGILLYLMFTGPLAGAVFLGSLCGGLMRILGRKASGQT